MPRTDRNRPYDECGQIHALHQRAASVSAFAVQFQIHESTVCRQLRCHAGPSGYSPNCAATRRWAPHRLHPAVWDSNCERLRHHRSPKQLASRLKWLGWSQSASRGSICGFARTAPKGSRWTPACASAAIRGTAGRGCIPGWASASAPRPSTPSSAAGTGKPTQSSVRLIREPLPRS